jgi:hypothetical protein
MAADLTRTPDGPKVGTMTPTAHLYPCSRFPCDARANVVYQGQEYPHGIYGACLDHLTWASDPSRSLLEGARILHFTTVRSA